MSGLFEDKDKKKKILLIDGMYLIFNSFYAFGNMRSASGFPTGAIYGFITRIDNLIKELKPDFLVVAMDSKGKTFRHEIYPDYKANRKEAPDDLLKQIPIIKEYLKIKQIDTIELPGYEGDDIIYFYKKESEISKNEVVIFTADKDMFQLVDDNTTIFHPKLKKLLNADGIKEHFGLFPDQIVDYLALMGDSSDNIPGAKGIGEKTAKKLIDLYGSIDSMFENINNIENKFKKKIEASKNNIELSKHLIQLNTEKPDILNFKNKEFKNVTSKELALFYKKYSFKTMLNKIDAVLKENGEVNQTGYSIIKSKTELINLITEIYKQGFFAFDLETTGLSFYESDIVGISISFLDSGYYIPVKYPEETKNIYININDIITILSPVFNENKIKKIGFNLKFDILFLKKIGIIVNGVIDDGMIASGLIFPNRRSHKLKDLTFEHLNINQNTFDNITGTGSEKKPIDRIDIDIVGKYCIDDSNTSLKLVTYFKPLLKEKDLEHLYNSIEIPLISVLTDIEYTGIKINLNYLQNSIIQLEKKLADIEKTILNQAGYKLNINSSKQLGELLFEKMKLPIAKKTKITKNYSTDIEVLSEFKNIPIVNNIIKYRGWKKLHSTYLIGIKERLDPHGRIHTSFNQTVTATGRLSSSNPNLQNIPVFETDEINIRKLFISDSDKKLLAADYSQIELRVMAHFSKDKNLKNAFINNIDIHTQTADLVFGRDLFMDNKLKRKRAKIINFSIIYGSGPYSLSKELEVSFKDAKEFIETYFFKYSGVKDFIENTIENAEKSGSVRTMENRTRELPELQSTNPNVKENGKRMAVNTIIQGSAAEIIKKAMINIHKKTKKMVSKMLLSVHDEIIFEYPINEEKELIKIVSHEMKNAVKLDIPLEVSIKTGKNWGEMSKYEVKNE